MIIIKNLNINIQFHHFSKMTCLCVIMIVLNTVNRLIPCMEVYEHVNNITRDRQRMCFACNLPYRHIIWFIISKWPHFRITEAIRIKFYNSDISCSNKLIWAYLSKVASEDSGRDDVSVTNSNFLGCRKILLCVAHHFLAVIPTWVETFWRFAMTTFN